MDLVKLNASYMTIRVPMEDRHEWEPLLVASEAAMLALPSNVLPPASIGCARHATFEPTCSLCWLSYRAYAQYRLYRMWPEGGALNFRIPVGGVIMLLLQHKEKLGEKVWQQLREFLIQKYPRKDVLNFDPEKFPVQLFPYQLQAVTQAIKYRRCMISAPPGSGKTEMGSALIASMPSDWKVGWFTHTRTLLRQSQRRLQANLGEPIGAISGEDDFEPKRITVAMVQTVTRRGQEKNDPQIIGWLHSLDALILDEAHHAPASTFYWTIMSCTNAWVRFGLTATPMREYGEEEVYMWCAFSPLIVKVEPHELVAAGRLVPIELIIYDLEGHVQFKGVYSSWQEEYMEQIVRNDLRNVIIAAEAIVNRPAVVLVWSIEHIERIADKIRAIATKYELDIKIGVMHGDTKSVERAILIEQFEKGQIDVLIISDVGKEGLNIINMRTLIIAAGQKSKVAAIQRVGRGMRPKKWGYVRVVDFYDAGDITRRHSIRRVRIYQQMLPVIRIKRLDAREGLKELAEQLRQERTALYV